MRFDSNLTDTALLHELGARLERRRIDANLTQAGLAQESGISKRTLERIESGHSTDSAMLLRVLRSLKLIEGLESLIPDLPQSPMTLLKQRGRARRRVTPPRAAAKADKRTEPWKWGE